CFKEFSGHSRILGQIDATLGLTHDGIKAPEKLVRAFPMIWKVQCKCHSWLWEAQHPHRLAVAKGLQDGEERTISRSGDFFEHGLNRVLPNFAWNHTLVLEEALRAVHSVPLEQVVQRVEK